MPRDVRSATISQGHRLSRRRASDRGANYSAAGTQIRLSELPASATPPVTASAPGGEVRRLLKRRADEREELRLERERMAKRIRTSLNTSSTADRLSAPVYLMAAAPARTSPSASGPAPPRFTVTIGGTEDRPVLTSPGQSLRPNSRSGSVTTETLTGPGQSLCLVARRGHVTFPNFNISIAPLASSIGPAAYDPADPDLPGASDPLASLRKLLYMQAERPDCTALGHYESLCTNIEKLDRPRGDHSRVEETLNWLMHNNVLIGSKEKIAARVEALLKKKHLRVREPVNMERRMKNMYENGEKAGGAKAVKGWFWRCIKRTLEGFEEERERAAEHRKRELEQADKDERADFMVMKMLKERAVRPTAQAAKKPLDPMVWECHV